jgi:hypothetical protein
MNAEARNRPASCFQSFRTSLGAVGTHSVEHSLALNPGNVSAAFPWILLHRTPSNAGKAKKVIDFLCWGLSDGQGVEPALGYAGSESGGHFLIEWTPRMDTRA